MCDRRQVTHLGIDLRWGTWPSSASVIPPLWEVGQRKSDLMRCSSPTGTSSGRSRRGDNGSVVAGVRDKVILSHCVFVFRVLLEES